jgi:pilus assembly protein CpaF
MMQIQEEEVSKKIKENIREQLDLSQSTSDEELLVQIEKEVFAFSRTTFLSAKDKKALVDRVYHSFRGLDVLQPLIDDTSITEIMINSAKEIFIERDGNVFQADVRFESEERLEDIIQTIVGRVNRVVNELSPIVDARLEDGSRVNVVLSPVALKGATMTIRKFPEKPLTMHDLIDKGSLTEEVANFLRKLVKAKFNIFIGGGTGSGKTTFLNVLSNDIPADERIITIEDSAELQIINIPNLVSLETRNPNTEGKGQITIRDLIKSSLRMRPNRIVVGEVRGVEAIDMLQAMNTGHDGSLSTGHANSTEDMLSRLETMVLSGANLPIEAIRKQICSAIDIMVHLARLRDHSRRVMEITEVVDLKNGEILLNPLYTFCEEGETEDGRILGKLKPVGNPLQNEVKLRMAGFKVD